MTVLTTHLLVPPAVVYAIERLLPHADDIEEVQNTLDSILGGEVYESLPEVGIDACVRMDWDAGTAPFDEMSIIELKKLLQWDDTTQDAPFFHNLVDLDRQVVPGHKGWDAAVAQGTAIPLSLKWHQVTGVVAILHRIFLRTPAFVLDDVGLGKTMQAIATLCYLENMRARKAQRGCWGGIFGKHNCCSTLGMCCH